ncbi:hypothetical protein GDO81_018043 [Engystomops pustulosus]|uniref:RNA-binding protein Luc7-like 2 n=1 Tax=Engystomops pustulosus TaxID=76066 RepID=A0AAV7A433_ENGPU|nr:hypothetical protein GDO81_018043 [Engystomops pustulosus]
MRSYRSSFSGDRTRQRIKFSDERVCKSHLLNCCPHDILSGTRMDLGECLKVHDLALRADYEIASKQQDFFFELDAMDHLKSFIADCDRRTDIAKKRLADTQEEISAEVAAKAERVHELNEEIGKLLAKAEQLGAEGNVEESQKVMDEVEKTRICKREAERIVAEKQEKRNQDRMKRREERDREERDKMKRRSRSRDGRRHCSSSREHKRKTRSRSRDKRHHRSRDRSRDRSSKSKSSREERTSRDRDRSRERTHKKRSYEFANGKSGEPSSEEPEAGEI